MAKYSLISYKDPKIGSWTVPQPIQGIGDEAIEAFVQNMQRTIKAGKVSPENDGFEFHRDYEPFQKHLYIYSMNLDK